MASDSLKLVPEVSARPRSTEEVRADIARARAELADAAQALRTQVAEKIDWRTWVRENPAPVLIGAFAIGFWIGYRD
jgi:hypothetical protein